MTCHLVEKVDKLQSYLADVIVSWCVNPQEVAKYFTTCMDSKDAEDLR